MSFSADPIYDDIVRFYFADVPTIGQEVWSRYVTYVNPALESNPTFVDFLETQIDKPGSIQTLSNTSSVPTSGSYNTYLEAYFSYRTPEDRLNIYKAFLAQQGYPTASEDTPSTTTLSSKDFQDSFGNFVYNLSNVEKTTMASLQAFVSQYNAYGFGSKALELPVISTPPEFYDDYITAFFGGRTDIEKQDIWRSFLVSIGYPKTDPVTQQTELLPTQEELDSSAMKIAFKRYADSLRAKELMFSDATSISPHQVETDTVLQGIMDSLGNILNTTELLVRNQASALIVSGKVQQEYTTMLSRVPTLTPSADAPDPSADNPEDVPPLKITAPSQTDLENQNWNLTDFILGYNRISLEDVVEWGVNQALNNKDETMTFEQPAQCTYNFVMQSQGQAATYPPTDAWDSLTPIIDQTFASAPFTLSDDDKQNIIRGFLNQQGDAQMIDPESVDLTNQDTINAFSTYLGYLPQTSQASFAYRLQQYLAPVKCLFTFSYDPNPTPPPDQPEPVITTTLGFSMIADDGHMLTRDECYTNIGNIIKKIFADNAATIANFSTLDSGIPGRYLSNVQEDVDARIEQNAVLQQYVENIRAWRTAAKTVSQNLQTTVTATKESINQHTALWTSILDTIYEIIKAIFQRR